MIENLAAGGTTVDHPLLNQTEDVQKVAFVVITSDRGMAGAYNSSVIRATERSLMAHREQGRDYSLILIGRKAEGYFRFRHYRIDASFTGVSDTPTYANAREIADLVAKKFISGEVQRVELIYTEFISLGSQRVAVRRFLPLESTATVAAAGGGIRVDGGGRVRAVGARPLGCAVAALCRSSPFGAMLEGAASEHASRQRAMKAATDNADELQTS